MTVCLKTISAAFPDHVVTAQQRADGGQLIILEKDGVQVKRSIPSPQLSAPVRTEWVISAIRRDIEGAAAVSPVVAGRGAPSKTAPVHV
ncbi:DUF3509 domain-containing protein [Pseudomonas sp. RIT-PI-AD]|uniref:DUF3509 domain-containing protein n=1 Tax=Pseudomonas sp. RIT-PI-AD TaxID=3035294 RepID=UPI0021D8802D|nr:DUF3509 domain-containing protein [Pseudomonas sp. RIT-PI-AD]